MGTITEENHRSLSTSSSYEEAELTGMDMLKFSEELSRLINSKGIPIQIIVDTTGLSKSYINKLRNLKQATVQPSRSVILNIALALDASLSETNSLLKAARYQELYARDTTESVIIWGMLHNLTGTEIRTKLSDMGIGTDILRQE